MHNRKVILVSCIILFIYFIIGFIYLCSNRVSINLRGSDNIEVEVGSEYVDLGAESSICKKRKCKDISSNIVVKGNVDTNKIGEYKLLYEVTYQDKVYKEERIINVVDKEKPVIELVGDKEVKICPSGNYQEMGYKAIDNYDGDLTNKVEVVDNGESILYKVADSSGNSTFISRFVIKKDEEKPVIKLKGSTTITVKLNGKYNELGYTVSDNCEDLNDKVKVSGNVDTTKEGIYKLTYSVEDSSGNKSSVVRTIKVTKEATFNTSSKSEYIESLENYIKEKNYSVSIGYVNLKTGYTYLYRPNVVYYGASLVKTVDALYVYEKMNFSESVRKKVEKAISVSDNNAHNYLVNLIGINNLRNYGRSLGASNFLTRSDSDYFGNTTVRDQIAIWKYLYKFINNNSKGSELKKYFINSYSNYLLFDGISTTMHKYGYYGSYYHDVGIVYSDTPYLVVILTKHGSGNFRGIVQDLSKKIYGLNEIDI